MREQFPGVRRSRPSTRYARGHFRHPACLEPQATRDHGALQSVACVPRRFSACRKRCARCRRAAGREGRRVVFARTGWVIGGSTSLVPRNVLALCGSRSAALRRSASRIRRTGDHVERSHHWAVGMSGRGRSPDMPTASLEDRRRCPLSSASLSAASGVADASADCGGDCVARALIHFSQITETLRLLRIPRGAPVPICAHLRVPARYLGCNRTAARRRLQSPLHQPSDPGWNDIATVTACCCEVMPSLWRMSGIRSSNSVRRWRPRSGDVCAGTRWCSKP